MRIGFLAATIGWMFLCVASLSAAAPNYRHSSARPGYSGYATGAGSGASAAQSAAAKYAAFHGHAPGARTGRSTAMNGGRPAGIAGGRPPAIAGRPRGLNVGGW